MDAIDGTGRGGFLLSCVIHAGIISVIVFGLPAFLRHKVEVPHPTIPVHIVNAAALAPVHHDAVRHDAAPDSGKTDSAKGQPAPPPVTGTQDTAHNDKPPNMAWQGKDASTDKLSRAQPQQSVEQAASVLAWATAKIPTAPPVPPHQAVEKTDPTQDPNRQSATVAAADPPPPPPPSIDDQMDSLVKSLSAQASALEVKKKKVRRHSAHVADQEEVAVQTPPPSPQRLQSNLTADELDIVRSQVRRCWSYMGNPDRVRGIQVPIHLVLRPDGSVVSARVVDDGHEDDPLWRSVADSALRALRNPNCSPLNLPPAKYDAWRSATFTFSFNP